MTDRIDPSSHKKSTPDLKAIPGGAQPTPESQVQEKRKYRDIHYQMACAMTGMRTSWRPFPVKIHRVVDVRGENLAYAEERGLVREVSNAFLNSVIAAYWDTLLPQGERPVYLGSISAGDCDKIRSLWYALAPAVKEPFPLVTWASDPRPSHHKVPFDPSPVEQDLADVAPLFFEMMGRTTNSAALMAFIGSIFDEQSQRQQYLWIYGGGRNGKGALVRCLDRLLAKVYASEEAPTGESKHWTWGLLGKRLVVFADCNNASFVTSGRFKSLTGEDKIRVEIKKGAILSLDIPAKYMFTSNARPRIASITADMRRIIYCYIQAVAKADEVPDYEDRLQAEVPAFISACWHRYQQMTNGNPRCSLPVDNSNEVADLARDSEHEYEAFVDGRIHVVSYPDSTPFNERASIRPERMKELMILSGFKTNYEREGLRKYLERMHYVVCKSIKVDGKVFPAFINCSAYPAKDSEGR